VDTGYLYVLGGEKNLNSPSYRDFWRMSITALDEWKPLPGFPVPKSLIDRLVGYSMVVHGNSAYHFSGRPQLQVFDLETRTWSTLRTSIEGAWPYYPHHNLRDFAMHCIDGTIYVFGGSHAGSRVGCNLLLALDIVTCRWTRLSGIALPTTASYEGPGPRRLASSWIGKDRNTIFVLYGDADRPAARLFGQSHGASNGYAHDDFWSWDIRARSWERRRLLGNIPSPRTEMACTYVIISVSSIPTCAECSSEHRTRQGHRIRRVRAVCHDPF
jgi:hypothetical protein